MATHRHSLTFCPAVGRKVGRRNAIPGLKCPHCKTVLPEGDETVPVVKAEPNQTSADEVPLLISTTDSIPGMRVTDFHGAVIARMGPMGDLQEIALMTALDALIESARETGGNAVIGFRFSNSTRLIIVYGTAVTVEPDDDSADADGDT